MLPPKDLGKSAFLLYLASGGCCQPLEFLGLGQRTYNLFLYLHVVFSYVSSVSSDLSGAEAPRWLNLVP